jgi:glycosyltransferase involved in cell wall biosynthesis
MVHSNKKDNPIISFIVPTYNQSKRHKRLLQNIDESCNLRYEVILCDDCSDQSVGDYSKIYNVKVQTNQVNMGPGFCRNKGIKYATGQFLFFMDDDDELCQKTFYKFESYIKGNQGADVILINFNDNNNDVMSNKIILEEFIKSGKTIENLKDKYIKKILDLHIIPLQCQAYLFNRKFLISNNIYFPNTYLAEDQVFLTKAIIKSKIISYFSDGCYKYYTRIGSLKTSGGLKGVVNIYDSLSDLLSFIKGYKLKGMLEQEILQRSISRLVRLIAIRLVLLSIDDQNIFVRKIKNKRNIIVDNNFIKNQNDLFFLQEIENRSYTENVCDIVNKYLFQGLIKKCKNSNIYIYCYGPLGRAVESYLYNNLKKYNISLKGFIDDGKTLNISTFNYEFFTESFVKNMSIVDKRSIVIIANPQPHIADSILNNLRKKNIKNELIINLSEWK